MDLASGKNLDLASGKNLDLASGKNLDLASGKNLDFRSNKNFPPKTQQHLQLDGLGLGDKLYEDWECKLLDTPRYPDPILLSNGEAPGKQSKWEVEKEKKSYIQKYWR